MEKLSELRTLSPLTWVLDYKDSIMHTHVSVRLLPCLTMLNPASIELWSATFKVISMNCHFYFEVFRNLAINRKANVFLFLFSAPRLSRQGRCGWPIARATRGPATCQTQQDDVIASSSKLAAPSLFITAARPFVTTTTTFHPNTFACSRFLASPWHRKINPVRVNRARLRNRGTRRTCQPEPNDLPSPCSQRSSSLEAGSRRWTRQRNTWGPAPTNRL